MSNTSFDLNALSKHHFLTPWLVCCTAALFFLYTFVQQNMFNALGADLMSFFKVDAVGLSALSAMGVWGNVLMIPFAGLVLDRFSARQILLTAMMICVLMVFVFATTSYFSIAILARFLSGMSSGFCFLGCVVVASRWFPPEKMGQIIGVVVTMAMLGGALAQEPMVILIGQFGWQQAIFLTGLFGIALWFLMFLGLSDTPKARVFQPEAQMTVDDLSKSFVAATSNPQNWFCGLYTSLMNIMIMVMGAVWGAAYLENVHGLTHHQANEVTFLIFIGTMIGSPLAGVLSDRIKKRKIVMQAGAITSLIIAIAIIYVPQHSFLSLMILFLGLGITTSTQVISYPVIAESNLSRNTGVSEALASFLIMGGGAISQNLYGFMMNLHSSGSFFLHSQYVYRASDYQYGFWLVPLAFIISLLFSFLVKETNAKSIV